MPYVLDSENPILIYEVMLPANEPYKSKLKEVLDCFFNREELRKVPAIVPWLQRIPQGSEQEGFLNNIQNVISGYSIYEVNGRFGTPEGPIDERTWIIRFIIHDRESTNGMSGKMDVLAKEVIRHLITRRFAEELGTEQEIWFVAYEHPRLQRWIRSA